MTNPMDTQLKPDGYGYEFLPAGIGTGTDFYSRVWVRISTRNPFADGQIITLPDPNLTRWHP
jgi:hypothetical protein